MSPLRRSAHAVYELTYHVVWCPKYRKALLGPPIQRRLKALFVEIAEEYDFEIRESAVERDHVHVMVAAPPRLAPATLVRILKSLSARELFRAFPWLRQQCWSGKLWNEGCFVRAVGDRITTEVIQQYIRYQRHERHGGQLDLFK